MLFGYFIVSYFLGLAISEFSASIGLVNKKNKLPDGYENDLILCQEIYGNFDQRVVNQHERTIYLMHIGASVGVSAFWSAIMMLIINVYRYFICKNLNKFPGLPEIILLLCFGVYMIIHSRKKARQVAEEKQAMVNYMHKTQKNN
jgi:hypothetical protein